MQTFEMPFYNRCLRVSYTEKGLVEIYAHKRKPKGNHTHDHVERRIKQKLNQYLRGQSKDLGLAIDWKNVKGTDFQKKVWKKMAKIPYGKVVTYGELAKQVGSPNGARAIGTTCGKNPLLLVVPCHRVVASSGLGGFGIGLPMKRKLLDLEAS